MQKPKISLHYKIQIIPHMYVSEDYYINHIRQEALITTSKIQFIKVTYKLFFIVLHNNSLKNIDDEF